MKKKDESHKIEDYITELGPLIEEEDGDFFSNWQSNLKAVEWSWCNLFSNKAKCENINSSSIALSSKVMTTPTAYIIERVGYFKLN